MLACPGCRTAYPLPPPTMPPHTPFRCPRCGFSCQLGQLLAAMQHYQQQVQQYHQQQAAQSDRLRQSAASSSSGRIPAPRPAPAPAPVPQPASAPAIPGMDLWGAGMPELAPTTPPPAPVRLAAPAPVATMPPLSPVPALAPAGPAEVPVEVVPDHELPVEVAVEVEVEVEDAVPKVAPAAAKKRPASGLDLAEEEEEAPPPAPAGDEKTPEPFAAGYEGEGPPPAIAPRKQEGKGPLVPILSLLGVAVLGGGMVFLIRGSGEEEQGKAARRPRPQPAQKQPVQPKPTPPTPAPVQTAQPPKPKPAPPRRAPTELLTKATQLLQGEKHDEAAALLAGIAPEDRELLGNKLEELEERVKVEGTALDAARQALSRAEKLRDNGDAEGARRAFEGFLREHPTLPAGPTANKVKETAASLRKEVPLLTGAPESAKPRVETPARAAAFEQAAKAGAERATSLASRIEGERARAKKEFDAEVERARSAALQKPINLDVRGQKLEAAYLTGYDELGFSLKVGADDLSYAWEAVRFEDALKLRKLGVRDEDAGDQTRLGYWCLRLRNFAAAKRAFARAAQLDKRLAGSLPDLAALEEKAQVFGGDMQRRGSGIKVVYEFEEEAEARDFSPATQNTKHAVDDGRLVIGGQGVYYVALKQVGFDGRVSLQAQLGPTSSKETAFVFGISFAQGTPREQTYLAAVFPDVKQVGLFRYSAKTNQIEPLGFKNDAVAQKSPLVRLEVTGDRVEVRSRGQTQLSKPIKDPVWDDVRVVVGGQTQGKGTATLEKLNIEGKVRTAWLRKAFGELEALVQGHLAQADELPVHASQPRPSERAALSAEDELGRSGVADDLVSKVGAALDDLERLDTSDAEAWPRLIDVVNRMTKVLDQAPDFPAAYYARGVALLGLGSTRMALPDIQSAQRLCPRFHEALAAEAVLLAGTGKLEAALAAAEEAVKLAPDGTHGLLARGMIRFQKGDHAPALQDLELALALAPWEDDLRGMARNVRHVLDGPPWTRKLSHETEHYLLETNIPSLGKTLAEELEVVRAYYLQAFAIDDPRQPGTPKSRVLVFDTAEGYHSYADLSMNDRVEWTAGCYVPRYRQLLLFEDKSDSDSQEVRHTLYHEGFHQFMHELVGDVVVPFWLNEGLAEYFSACEVKGKAVTKKGLVLEGRLADMKVWLAGNRNAPMAFDKLMKESPAEFYSGPVWAKYAQAWAMVHWFMGPAPADARERFKRYVRRIREGTGGDEAFQECWKGVDWRGLEREFTAFVGKLQ